MTSEAVTENTTWPKINAPAAAASVSGTAWVRSVPTNCPAASLGYRNRSSTIISEPEPTEVIPTIRPPTTPMTTVWAGRTCTSAMAAVRGLPLRRSSA